MTQHFGYAGQMPSTGDPVEETLRNPSVHDMAKRWLREALTKDAVDAWADAALVARLLEQRLDNIQGP